MNKARPETPTKSKGSVLSLLKQNRHLLANRLINTYQEELGLDPVEQKQQKQKELDDSEMVGMTTID